ncbi:Aspartyl/Asparaginyl beta-hydroxylase [compost metagenome]
MEFLVDGLQVPMHPGECWFLDLSRPHRVDNPGPGERVHLVLDCQPNDWLLEAVHQGLPGTPALQPGRAGQAFARFCELVRRDAKLAGRLRALTDIAEFQRTVVALGAEHALHFSEADVLAAMRQGKRAWNDQWRA